MPAMSHHRFHAQVVQAPMPAPVSGVVFGCVYVLVLGLLIEDKGQNMAESPV